MPHLALRTTVRAWSQWVFKKINNRVPPSFLSGFGTKITGVILVISVMSFEKQDHCKYFRTIGKKIKICHLVVVLFDKILKMLNGFLYYPFEKNEMLFFDTHLTFFTVLAYESKWYFNWIRFKNSSLIALYYFCS